jgi:hypothetical protein
MPRSPRSLRAPSALQLTADSERPGHVGRSKSSNVRNVEEKERRTMQQPQRQQQQKGAVRQLKPAPSPLPISARAASQLAGVWKSRPAWLNERIATAYSLVSAPDFEGFRAVDADDYWFGRVC